MKAPRVLNMYNMKHKTGTELGFFWDKWLIQLKKAENSVV